LDIGCVGVTSELIDNLGVLLNHHIRRIQLRTVHCIGTVLTNTAISDISDDAGFTVMAGIVGSSTAIGSLIPQQGVIIKRIQGVTDVVVLGVRNGVSRCGDGAVSVDFCVTTQRISDVLIGGIEL